MYLVPPSVSMLYCLFFSCGKIPRFYFWVRFAFVYIYIYIYIYWVVKTLELHYNNIYICVHLCTYIYIYIYLYICVHFILSLSRVVVNQWLGWWVMIWVAVWLRFGFWWWCLSFGVLVFGVDDFGVLMVVVGGWFLVFQFYLGVSCCGWLVSCFGG